MPFDCPLLLAGHPVLTAHTAPLTAPWDHRLLADVSQAGPVETSLAAEAAARSFAVTRQLPAIRRAAILADAATRLAARRAELVALLRDEAGKPVELARAEVDRAIGVLEGCSHDAARVDAHVHTGPSGRTALTRPIPRGPLLAITALNFPLASVCQRIGPAVAAGCPIVIRPAPRTPSAALLVGELLVAAGWPPDAISVLPCDEPSVDRLVADPRFATVAWTGCARTGWRVRAHAGRRNLLFDPGAHVTLVVEPDADLDAAVPRLASGVYAHAGQIYAAVQRILVHRSIYDEVRARFVAAAAAVERGDPARDDVVCGPMIDEDSRARVEQWMERAEHLGARRLGGGVREGTVITPAVFEAEDPFVELSGEDPFGPVTLLEPYSSLDLAIDRVNRLRHGGETGLFTRSLPKVWHVFQRLEAGSLIHDEHPVTHLVRAPVTGRPTSAGRAAMDDLSELRTVVLGGPA